MKKTLVRTNCLQYGGEVEESSLRTEAENKGLLMLLVPLLGSVLTSLLKHRTAGG